MHLCHLLQSSNFLNVDWREFLPFCVVAHLDFETAQQAGRLR
jgi:hypothetical protein